MRFREAKVDEYPDEYVVELEVGSQGSKEQLAELFVAKLDGVVEELECNKLANTIFEAHTIPSEKSIHVLFPCKIYKLLLS